MAARSALVTGGSSGIGLAIARELGESGYSLTISGRRAEKLAAAADQLRGEGIDVQDVAANMAEAEAPVELVAVHRERFGRLDVLVNSAGVGIGAPVAEIQTKQIDMQLSVNLRALIVTTREALPMLQAAGAEHGQAMVINLASIAGRSGQPWLSVYAATKAAVLNWTNGLQTELGKCGVRATALAPGFVDTPMTDFVKGEVSPEQMIQPEDLAKTVTWLLSLSSHCRVPEVFFERPGESI